MSSIRVAVIGLGKIARDQHLPAIAGTDSFTLTATVDPHAPGLPGIAHFETLSALFADGPTIEAAILCTPPQLRFGLANSCLSHGLHVLLEKPPGATLGEVEILRAAAGRSGVSLFAAWHSRFAPCIAAARDWLADRRITEVSVTWHEDVHVWHPGQLWIWQPGGLGVFDPGINALSMLTHILPGPLHVTEATLAYPANRAAPIAARLMLCNAAGTPIRADFDFRQNGPARWDIEAETDAGAMTLTHGGAALSLPSGAMRPPSREYYALYERFAALIRDRASDVDVTPLRLVADAFLLGEREVVEAF